jgi:lantibiotic transport system permease protein
MIASVKAEWLKEKRSSNRKMLLLVPIIFITFSFFMSLMMGGSSSDKNYLVAAAYNWYPLVVLPAVISLLCSNIMSRDRKRHMDEFIYSLGISKVKTMLSKVIIVIVDLFIILAVSLILLLMLEITVIHEKINIFQLLLASFCLFLGNLPLIPISLFLYKISNVLIVILTNFIFGISAAVIAIKPIWHFFPWSYGIRMMSPVLGIHPNGTFLSHGDELLNQNSIYTGNLLGISVFLILTILFYLVLRKDE